LPQPADLPLPQSARMVKADSDYCSFVLMQVKKRFRLAKGKLTVPSEAFLNKAVAWFYFN
jgi:hypothetical protein